MKWFNIDEFVKGYKLIVKKICLTFQSNDIDELTYDTSIVCCEAVTSDENSDSR